MAASIVADRPPNVTRSLRKGYYASVTYTDHLVGMLLDKLAALGHEDDTVVGLIGEHCWQVNPFPRLGFGAAQPVLSEFFCSGAELDGLQDLSDRWLLLRTAGRAQHLGQTHELRAR